MPVDKNLVFLIFSIKEEPHNIYNPINNELPQEAFSHPVRIPSTSTPSTGSKRSKPAGSMDIPIISGTFIYPGVNQISRAEAEFIQNEPTVGKRYFESGCFTIVEPQLEEGQDPTGLSIDYSPGDVQKIIPFINDLEWLERSDRKETREGISKSLSRRIDNLRKRQNPNMTAISGQFI